MDATRATAPLDQTGQTWRRRASQQRQPRPP